MLEKDFTFQGLGRRNSNFPGFPGLEIKTPHFQGLSTFSPSTMLKGSPVLVWLHFLNHTSARRLHQTGKLAAEQDHVVSRRPNEA